jgi:hypothetical protein
MKHIDTLAKYREYIAAGYTESQADVAVKSWAEAYDMSREGLATKEDIKILESEITASFKIVYIIGGAIFTICCLPVLQKLFQ